MEFRTDSATPRAGRRTAGRTRLVFAWATIACATVAGCVPERNWQGVRPVEPPRLPAERSLGTAAVDPAAWPTEDWWTSYGDPQLDALVKEALTGSPTLQAAQARLRAAQAQATRAAGPRLPTVSADAQTTRQRYSENGLYPAPFAGNYFTDARVALDFSYDIDFWGRNRALFESARASARAAAADREAARLTLAVAVARAYFQLNLQFAFLDIVQDSLKQQNTILELTQQRAAKGLDNIAQVKQAQTAVALTHAALDYTEASVRLVRSQLGALLGTGPDRGAELTRPHLPAPQTVRLPSRLPAELLGRRPDVVAQRWRVEAAARSVGAAEAAFYPNVNLAAFAGFQTIGLSKLLDGGSAVGGAGPALSLPLFNRRELRGSLQSEQAQYDQSVSEYNQTLIEALHDVADVVTNWDALVKESDDARIAEDAAQHAYAVTRDRYRAGLDNYLTVLNSENEVFTTQAIRAELLAREYSLRADLVRALGGGFPDGAAGK